MTLFHADLGPSNAQRTILSTTNTTTILAATLNGSQSVAKISFCNKTAGALTFDLEAYDGTTAYSLEFTRALAVGVSYELRDEVLPRGWSLRAKASGPGIHVTVLFALVERNAAR